MTVSEMQPNAAISYSIAAEEVQEEGGTVFVNSATSVYRYWELNKPVERLTINRPLSGEWQVWKDNEWITVTLR